MACFTLCINHGSHIHCSMATLQSKFPRGLGSVFRRWYCRCTGYLWLHGIPMLVTIQPLCASHRCLSPGIGASLAPFLWNHVQLALAVILDPRVHLCISLFGSLLGSRLLSCAGRQRFHKHYGQVSSVSYFWLWWSLSHQCGHHGLWFFDVWRQLLWNHSQQLFHSRHGCHHLSTFNGSLCDWRLSLFDKCLEIDFSSTDRPKW